MESGTRVVSPGALGSRTPWWERVRPNGLLYHLGQFVAAIWARTVLRLPSVLFLVFTWMVGLRAAVLLTVLGCGVCLTGWIGWRRRPSGANGAAAFTLSDALTELARRWTLDVRWPKACRSLRLRDTDNGRTLRLLNRQPISGGFTAVVRSGAAGVPVSRLQSAADDLTDVIGCKEVTVVPCPQPSRVPGLLLRLLARVMTVDPGAKGGAALTFLWTDATVASYGLVGMPVGPDGHLAYGRRQTAGVAASIRIGLSIIVAGLTGSGKSNIVLALFHSAVQRGYYMRLYISDPKGGTEHRNLRLHLGHWRTGECPVPPHEDPKTWHSCVGSVLQVEAFAKTPEETVKMLDRMERDIAGRTAEMEDKGIRNLQGTVSQEYPALVFLGDESLALAAMLKQGTASPLGRLVWAGRNAGAWAILNTQIGAKDTLGRFRELVANRICLRSKDHWLADEILGDRAEANGAKCSEIKAPGEGFSYEETAKLAERFKAPMVTDEDYRLIAAGKLPRGILTMAEMSDEVATLYRWYDQLEGGVLLYVGKSNDVGRRVDEHARKKRAMQRRARRVEMEHYPTVQACLAAEQWAIKTEFPLFNDQHNHDNPDRIVLSKSPEQIEARERAVLEAAS